MKHKDNSTVTKILLLFFVCSIVEYIEFLFIRLDQTIIADNIGTKLFCIVAIIITLKYSNLCLADIGFGTKGILKSTILGLALGAITFGVSYTVEILILQSQGQSASLRFYVTNFALTGASTQLTATAPALLICVAVNIINVLAEEGLFRGIILKLGTDCFGFATANWIQAALFGVWHIVMVVLSVYDGLMDISTAIIMAIGYVILAGILVLGWGMYTSITGTLWIGISQHFFNNIINNTLHVTTESGTDELQIVRIVLSTLLSMAIALIIRHCMISKNRYCINSPTGTVKT